jgi:glycosyltransferase involved in cell wall biosynthesis
MKALIFAYVWPEPHSSAAGVRTLELCGHLKALGYTPAFLSPCKENDAAERLRAAGYETIHCPANDTPAFQSLENLSPALVIYDRFIMEEQFGWRCREAWPEAIHLIDTQDLHSLRRLREKGNADTDQDREFASFFRADAALVVSAFELEWLKGKGFPEGRIFYLPFGAVSETVTPAFKERTGFIFLGNFRHPPNLDAVEYLAAEIWPEIRKNIPDAKLTLAGAYPPASVSALGGKKGITVKGNVPDHREELKRHRVLLAPLRFGAGIKGKVLESWACGLPVAGTGMAFEGLAASSERPFAETAVDLHENELSWKKSQESGYESLKNFLPEKNKERLEKILAEVKEKLPETRSHPFSRMLRQQNMQATKYFSLWIEEKNKGKL